MVARYAALLCAVVLGCGGDDGAAPGDGGIDAPVDAAADPTEAVFPRDRVIGDFQQLEKKIIRNLCFQQPLLRW